MHDEMCCRRSVSLKADKALVVIEVLAFGKRWFAFLPLRSFLVLRPVSFVGRFWDKCFRICLCV